MKRFRGGSKAPLAVAGILAAPLFFTALMAFSLKFDKPSEVLGKLGDPTKGTVGTIYLVTFAFVGVLVLIGLLSTLLRSRLANIVPAGAGILMTILLLIPLGTWGAEHTKRYPLGIDNLPQSSPQDIWLRGEWEHNAKTTARSDRARRDRDWGRGNPSDMCAGVPAPPRYRGTPCPAASRGDWHPGAATPRGVEPVKESLTRLGALLTWLTNGRRGKAKHVDVMAVADRLRPTLLQLARELRREKIAGVSPHQVGLLVAIKYAPGVTVGELATDERVSTAAMSKRVSRLERDGLVTRTQSETDRRRVGLTLTDDGQRTLRRVRSRRTAWLASRLDTLSPDELARVGAAVDALAHLLADEEGRR